MHESLTSFVQLSVPAAYSDSRNNENAGKNNQRALKWWSVHNELLFLTVGIHTTRVLRPSIETITISVSSIASVAHINRENITGLSEARFKQGGGHHQHNFDPHAGLQLKIDKHSPFDQSLCFLPANQHVGSLFGKHKLAVQTTLLTRLKSYVLHVVI